MSWIFTISVLLLAVCAVHAGDCPKENKRKFDFHHPWHFKLTVDNHEGDAANVILRGSTTKYTSASHTVAVGIQYETDKQNTGFDGKVCFKVMGARTIDVTYIGIPTSTCTPPPIISCSGTGGGISREIVTIHASKVGEFTRKCLQAGYASKVYVDFIADEGETIEVEDLFNNGCEVEVGSKRHVKSISELKKITI